MPGSRLADLGAHREAAGFLVVEREVLYCRNHMLALNAAYLSANNHSRQKRIFARIFECAATARVAREIHRAIQHEIEAAISRLGPDHRSVQIRNIRVPCCGRHDAGRKGCRLVARAKAPVVGNPDAGIRLDECGNTKASDPRHKP